MKEYSYHIMWQKARAYRFLPFYPFTFSCLFDDEGHP